MGDQNQLDRQKLTDNVEKQDPKGLPSFFKKKMSQPRPHLSFIFVLFKETSLQFLQQKIYVKNVHSVSSAGVQTLDLWNMSFFP